MPAAPEEHDYIEAASTCETTSQSLVGWSIGKKISFCMVAILLLLFAVLLNLPYQFVQYDGQVYGKESKSYNFGRSEIVPAVTSAGWPFQFYLNVQHRDEADLKQFSILRLFLNVVVAGSVIACDMTYRWKKSVGSRSGVVRKRRVSLLDLLIFTAVCGGTLVYWQLMTRRSLQAHDLATRINQQQGMAHVAPVLPAFFKDRVPEFFLKMHERIVAVELNSPDNELVSEVVVQPYLQRLGLSGSSYDSNRLEPMTHNPLLWILRISGRKLTEPDDLQMIGSMSQLVSLNLMRTSITSAAVNQWTGLSRIQFMNLVHTDLVLSELSSPPWRQQIRGLHLPRPPRGINDTLSIEGWQRLESLHVIEYEELSNDTPLKISLSNMPALKELKLDRFQKVELKVSDAPELEYVGFDRFVIDDPINWKGRVGNLPYSPHMNWYGKIELENTPKLETMNVHVGDLESFSRIGVGANFEVQLNSMVYPGGGQNIAVRGPISLSKRNRALNALTNCEGLKSLVLLDFDATNTDLHALKKIPGLESLSFEKGEFDRAQALKLVGMKNLRSLNIDSEDLDGPTVNFLLKGLPALESLQMSRADGVKALRLESHSLSRFDAKAGIFNLNALRLIDLPNFSSVLGLQYPVKHLHIANVPKLKGLVVQGPMPKDFLLNFGREIEVLGIGGESVTDETLLPFAELKNLRKLSLVDTKLSEQRLLGISELSRLQDLVISGEGVTEAVVEKISGLNELTRLEIQTAHPISSEVLSRFEGMNKLRFLTLRCQDPNSTEYGWISKLESLEMIRFDGWKCTPALIAALATLEPLAGVAFENSELMEAELVSLSGSLGGSFIRLGLQNSTVDSAGLQSLMRSRSAVCFELRNANVESGLIAEAMRTNRLFTAYADEVYQLGANLSPGGGGMSAGGSGRRGQKAAWDEVDPELLDPVIFRLLSSQTTGLNLTGPKAGPRSNSQDKSGVPDLQKSRNVQYGSESEWLDLLKQLGK